MKLKGKKEVKPTWGISFKLWWSFFWRCLLWGGVAGFVLGIIFFILADLVGLNGTLIGIITLNIVFILMSVFVFKRILAKRYKSFQILLIQDDDMPSWKIEEMEEAIAAEEKEGEGAIEEAVVDQEEEKAEEEKKED